MEKTMKSLKTPLLAALTIAGLLFAGAAAKADDLTIDLTSATQSGVGGDVLSFNATVTNNTATTIYLNGDNGSYVNAPLTFDDSPYGNYPLTLDPGDTASGILFNIDLPAGAPFGVYNGYFDITGGTDGNAQNIEGEAVFDVIVTPEPNTLLLLATGMATLAGAVRRRVAR
jgi:hypothetical protein